MRENLTSGSTGGRWKRGSPAGHLRVPGRCAEKRHHDGLVGTQPAGHLQPRQRPTLHGAFYRSELYSLARRIDEHLVRWAMHKFKRLRGKPSRAWDWLAAARQRQPKLFAHWHLVSPTRGRLVGAV